MIVLAVILCLIYRPTHPRLAPPPPPPNQKKYFFSLKPYEFAAFLKYNNLLALLASCS